MNAVRFSLMPTRLAKQIIYGLFYLIFLLILGTAVYYFFRPIPTCTDGRRNQGEEQIDCGGPCISCSLKTPVPLKVSLLEIFDNGNRTLTALAEIVNPNPGVGAARFLYTINIFDGTGKNIFFKSGQSFIYPGKNRTIIEAGIRIDSGDAARGEVIIGGEVWQSAAAFGEIPEKNLVIDNTSIRGERNGFTVRGTLSNNNAVVIDKVFVKVVFFDGAGIKQGASLTLLERLPAFGQLPFTIFVPVRRAAMAAVDLDKMKLIVEIVREYN